MTRRRDFDGYVFVDWSASSSPVSGANSIWIAEGCFDGEKRLRVEEPYNPDTRAKAEAWLSERLRFHSSAGRRLLVGVDFALGYPHLDVPRLVGRADATWTSMWELLSERLVEGARNANNRWDVASQLNERMGTLGFWGCPPRSENTWLRSTKAADRKVTELRLVEQSLRSAGSRPFSVWQLLGNGAVGSQSLTGIPVCARLRAEFALQVWPFETQTRLPPRSEGSHVLAEVWPGAIDVDVDAHAIKDAAQVLALVRWAAREDAAGTLEPWFELKKLSKEHRRVVETEGWILGHQP